MLAIEIMVEEILRLQNTVCFLQAQLREAKMSRDTEAAKRELAYFEFGMTERAQELIGRMCAAPLVIRYHKDDEIVHTDEHPFCDDPACGCHDDIDLIMEHLEHPFDEGLLTSPEYFRIKEGKQL